MTADVIILILVIVCVFLAGMAIHYLIQRQMSWWTFLAWSFLAVIFPVLGPILVILASPGDSRKFQ